MFPGYAPAGSAFARVVMAERTRPAAARSSAGRSPQSRAVMSSGRPVRHNLGTDLEEGA
jgi:hypothetical protein